MHTVKFQSVIRRKKRNSQGKKNQGDTPDSSSGHIQLVECWVCVSFVPSHFYLFNIFEIFFSEHMQLSLSIRGELVPGPLQIRKCKDAQAPHIKWCNTLGCLHLWMWNPKDHGPIQLVDPGDVESVDTKVQLCYY